MITELEQLFDESATQQLAYQTLLSAALRHRLAWHKGSGAVLDKMPVPPWWHTFVSDVVRSFLVTGVAFYKVFVRRGLAVCEVARPAHVLPRWSNRKRCFEPDRPGGWRILVLESPLHDHTGSSHGSRAADHPVQLRSACVRAKPATLRLMDLQANWSLRDESNSRPAVFTTISEHLANQNGSDRQWFKNVTNPDVLQTRAVDVDTNFSTLVTKRAETIRELDAITSLRRTQSASARVAQPGGDPLGGEERETTHIEHIVSDGRSYTEARPLHSLPDTKNMLDEAAHAVFFAFGVPPQALGKNINSERLASSNRLTEMALTSFDILIRQIRVVVGEALRSATETDSGSYLGFSVVLGQHELEALLPMLKPAIAVQMVSRTFDIPLNFVDPEGVRQRAMADPAGGGTPGAGGKKRPRTEEETVAVLRKKAREPST